MEIPVIVREYFMRQSLLDIPLFIIKVFQLNLASKYMIVAIK